MDLQKGMGITLGIQHADLVVPSSQFALLTVRQIALGWGASAEQHWVALLRNGVWFLTHNEFNHPFNQLIGSKKNFLSAAMQIQWLLEIYVTCI